MARPLHQLPDMRTAALLSLVLPACSAISAIPTDPFLEAIELDDVDLSRARDGSWSGEYTMITPPGTFAMFRHFAVTVDIAGGAYTRIAIHEPGSLRDDARFGALCEEVVSAGSITAVDAVSGASYSSRAFLKAVEDASMRAAGRTP